MFINDLQRWDIYTQTGELWGERSMDFNGGREPDSTPTTSHISPHVEAVICKKLYDVYSQAILKQSINQTMQYEVEKWWISTHYDTLWSLNINDSLFVTVMT